MKFARALFFKLTFLFFLTGYSLAQNSNNIPPIKFEDYRLKNGLRVILHQDKSTPVVAVNMFYHVGSKNEVAGKTGFAHLFEHMMFQGSKNYDANFYTPLQDAGANFINGVTLPDGTYYVESVPSNFLELTLYLEAGRMGGLLEAMTQEKFDIQREVVKNEFRRNFIDQPYGSAFIKIPEALYPANHPYHWATIGSMEDLDAASLDDVKKFFRTYYVPNNALLSIAGDFDEKQTKNWIQKYFGAIPKGREIVRPSPPKPVLNKEIRKTVEDNISLPRLNMVWHNVPQYSPGNAELEILSNILSNGRGSRLQSNLIYGEQIAQSVTSFVTKRELGGIFQIQASPKADKSLEEIEKEINLEIERIKKEPPTPEEMTRALNQIESQIIFDLQSVLSKGDWLSQYASYLNKPDYFRDNLDRYRRVTAADVQKAAAKYLTANRLVLTYIPRKNTPSLTSDKNAAPSPPKSTESDPGLIAKQTAMLPKPGPNPKLSLPPIEKSKLSNGMEVWLVRHNELPMVSMNMIIKSGITSEPAEKLGVASLTASLLRTGTKTRSALDISNQMQSLGAFLMLNLGWDWSNVGAQTLSKNFDQVLDIYADVIMNPSFTEKEFENLRQRWLGSLAQNKSDANAVADRVYNHVIYGEHPYGRPFLGSEDSVKNLSRADVAKYYESAYHPDNAVLIVVGNVEKEVLLPKLEKAFGGWKRGTEAASELPNIQTLQKTAIYLVDRPGSTQSRISIGQIGISRDNPDYFPLEVLNNILGFATVSRLSANLRESKGYAYEAYSSLTYFKGSGNFSASAAVNASVTKEAVMEFMNELNGIRGSIPITQKELDDNKQSIIRRLPSGFETVGQISFQLSNLVYYGLPDSYFNDYIQKIDAVSLADVNRVANKYLTPDKMAIVIVGDRKTIESNLKQLNYPIVIVDASGNPIQ